MQFYGSLASLKGPLLFLVVLPAVAATAHSLHYGDAVGTTEAEASPQVAVAETALTSAAVALDAYSASSSTKLLEKKFRKHLKGLTQLRTDSEPPTTLGLGDTAEDSATDEDFGATSPSDAVASGDQQSSLRARKQPTPRWKIRARHLRSGAPKLVGAIVILVVLFWLNRFVRNQLGNMAARAFLEEEESEGTKAFQEDLNAEFWLQALIEEHIKKEPRESLLTMG
ncbi:hypothetical protein cyc_06444 [Cyclospora cayetanensis]|uniref:Transmembrane protein n=1 Tax=Cyclospora cayetanensis TaxID=88456 RepID=A0A1D3D663_9EIME|nr:hypothetical protein cyc_06444 [Cyclospora cayetanensis]